MTDKRDLKRRIRARQQRTRERYTTARQHVLAGTPNIDVLELDELHAEGVACRVFAHPELRQVAPRALTQIRDVLHATRGDPATARLYAVVIEGHRVPTPDAWPVLQVPIGFKPGVPLPAVERFLARARAGLGGLSDGGTMIAVHVDGVPVVGVAWSNPVPHPTVAAVMILRPASAPMRRGP
jgi:hypothetical protein